MDKIPKIPPKYAKYSRLIEEMIKRGYQFVEYGIPPEFLLENILNTIDGILYFPSFVLYKIRILGAEARLDKIQTRVKK